MEVKGTARIAEKKKQRGHLLHIDDAGNVPIADVAVEVTVREQVSICSRSQQTQGTGREGASERGREVGQGRIEKAQSLRQVMNAAVV